MMMDYVWTFDIWELHAPKLVRQKNRLMMHVSFPIPTVMVEGRYYNTV